MRSEAPVDWRSPGHTRVVEAKGLQTVRTKQPGGIRMRGPAQLRAALEGRLGSLPDGRQTQEGGLCVRGLLLPPRPWP